MSFEYKDEELVLVVRGTKYPFRAPSAKEQRQIAKTFKEANEDMDVLEIYVGFFVALGLPREVLETMSMRGLVDLFTYAIGGKKN